MNPVTQGLIMGAWSGLVWLAGCFVGARIGRQQSKKLS